MDKKIYIAYILFCLIGGLFGFFYTNNDFTVTTLDEKILAIGLGSVMFGGIYFLIFLGYLATKSNTN